MPKQVRHDNTHHFLGIDSENQGIILYFELTKHPVLPLASHPSRGKFFNWINSLKM
jgi:hypothetical protein